jgi:hypothetical protein
MPKDGPNPLKRIYTPGEIAQPVERRRKSQNNLAQAMIHAIAWSVSPSGVFPQHLFWQRSGSDDIFHEQLYVPGGLVVAAAVQRIYCGNDVAQLIFGIDVQEPKALKYGTGVIVAEWANSQWRRTGVIHYRTNPPIAEHHIDWNHQQAAVYMNSLIMLYDRKFRLGRPTTPFILE